MKARSFGMTLAAPGIVKKHARRHGRERLQHVNEAPGRHRCGSDRLGHLREAHTFERRTEQGGKIVGDEGLRELHSAMDRHDGLFYLAAAAGFVTDHQAQGDRLDFGHLFKAYRGQFPFLMGGSDEDPLEHMQVDLAPERLGHLGLQLERLPGGHPYHV